MKIKSKNANILTKYLHFFSKNKVFSCFFRKFKKNIVFFYNSKVIFVFIRFCGRALHKTKFVKQTQVLSQKALAFQSRSCNLAAFSSAKIKNKKIYKRFAFALFFVIINLQKYIYKFFTQ